MGQLPVEYVAYLRSADALYGDTDYEFGGSFELEPFESIESMNQDLQIDEYAPGFTAFGSDGAGELYVFDQDGAVYLMPMIGMSAEAAFKLAESWSEFQRHIRPNV